MTASCGPRSPSEIRGYLVDRLNQALRRPGMFGGEMALRLILDHLVYAERQDEACYGGKLNEAILRHTVLVMAALAICAASAAAARCRTDTQAPPPT